MQLRNRFYCILIIFLLLPFPQATADLGSAGHSSHDASRSKLVSSQIRKYFVNHHYSHKDLDDQSSAAAYELYLKQLDYQKRFLLAEDVKALSLFKDKIDDEMNNGILELPNIATGILDTRAKQVQKLIDEIFAAGFDFDKKESFESDAEKRAYCSDINELKERWRQMIKFQVISRYLSLMETDGPDSVKNDSAPAQPNGGKPARTPQELKKEAIEKVEKNVRNLLERVLEAKEEERYDSYFNAFAQAFDPHSAYLPPRQKEDFDIHMSGSLEGIGARLQEKDGFIQVVNVIPGGAAYREGQLEPNDIILKVGEGAGESVDIVDMTIRDAVSLIRGKKGTTVKLTIKKNDGRILIVPIVRDVVQIEETFVKSTILKDEDGKQQYGYIKIPTFYRDFNEALADGEGRNSTDDVRVALEALKKEKINGLILDLRDNGGGALVDAVTIAGLFIDKGPVVQVKNDNGTIKVHADTEAGTVYDGPLLVLVNMLSASASEILAGALQDYGRAIIIGSEHTHGKGTVQTIIDMDRNMFMPNMEKYKPLGALKLTIQKFYRVSGDSTQSRGILPDIILPDRMQNLEYGEKYIEHSLPWDAIKSASYDKAKWQWGNIETSEAKSKERISKNEAFVEIANRAKVAAERKDKTIISLNIEDIKKEMKLLEEESKKSLQYHGRDYLEVMMDDENKNKKMSEEEIRQLWLKELHEDPYVGEALNVLKDLVS